MMKLIGGKSYDNGIDFVVHDGDKSFVYCARRNEVGDIETTRNVTYQKMYDTTLSRVVISAIMSLLIVLIIHFFSKLENEMMSKLGWLLAIIVLWSGFLSILFLDSREPKSHKASKYHAVEHKILNFYEEYGYLPRTTEDIEKMSSFSLCCGSTVAVVIAMFITLVVIAIMFVPTIFLKIMGCIAAVFITLYCWANGMCNFVQKWMIKTPTHEEIELGVCAMNRLSKEISVL